MKKTAYICLLIITVLLLNSCEWAAYYNTSIEKFEDYYNSTEKINYILGDQLDFAKVGGVLFVPKFFPGSEKHFIRINAYITQGEPSVNIKYVCLSKSSGEIIQEFTEAADILEHQEQNGSYNRITFCYNSSGITEDWCYDKSELQLSYDVSVINGDEIFEHTFSYKIKLSKHYTPVFPT